MSNLIPFNFSGADVRVITVDGEPWFVARDVALILGYANPMEAVRTHCKGVREILTPTTGGEQKIRAIPERDVYRLVLRSKLPAAEKFEEWVVGEVLPSIRKTGSYGAPDPIAVLNDPAAMRGLLLTYSEKVLTLESTVAEQAPKVNIYDRLVEADGLMNPTTAAKTLQVPPNQVFKFLRTNRWVYRRPGAKSDVAYQDKIEAGWLTHKSYVAKREDGTDKVCEQVMVTPKGLAKLAERLVGERTLI